MQDEESKSESIELGKEFDKENISWKIIDKYFKDNPTCLVSHHLESYNEFTKNGIRRIFHENNPIRFIEREDEGSNSENRSECMLYLGGKDGSKIYFGIFIF
jgi:DNA-directed RNA polymerase beta subunit